MTYSKDNEKLFKFKSWVGIVPVSWLSLRYLFNEFDILSVIIQNNLWDEKINVWNVFYIHDNCVRFPSWIGIVPVSWLPVRYLFNEFNI